MHKLMQRDIFSCYVAGETGFFLSDPVGKVVNFVEERLLEHVYLGVTGKNFVKNNQRN